MSKREITRHEDYGFFAPDSVTRRVWGYPTTPLIGIQRATVVEELDPHLVAAVDATGANYDRLATRYARTVQYFAAVAFADSRTVSKMADVLVKVHSKAIGIEPVSGARYDANDPDSQLWILVTGWHSVLKAYEMFGPGPLTEDEERQYWAECAIAAELQTCDPADVPRSRVEVRAYFDAWRPRLAASEATQRMMRHLLDGVSEVLPAEGVAGLARPLANAVIREATIATLPRHLRELGGIRPSPLRAGLLPLARLVMTLLHESPALRRRLLGAIAPRAVAIMEPHWNDVTPTNPVVLTPAEAWDRYGYQRPCEAHLDLRARQAERVFGRGERPSDEGLVESQAVLGALG